MSSRSENMAWCKQRALAELDRGDFAASFASFMSDMGKHPETLETLTSPLGMLLLGQGQKAATDRNAVELRRWIEGWA